MAARLLWWAIASAALAQSLATGPARVRYLTQRSDFGDSTAQSRPPSPQKPLQCFQISNPVLSDIGTVTSGYNDILSRPSYPKAPSCKLTLMDHHFANSYGQPFVAKYTPPPCKFTRVIMNYTVVSEGHQFDRLAVMYLGDVEVWRTSTAEPKPHPGIFWTFWKDMTPYLSLWRQPQTLIFDLGNIVDTKYTGLYNATLTATFIDDTILGPGAPPADLILPVSAMRSKQNAASAFTYPQDNATATVALPKNIKRAVFSVSATGQADEEFWWSNVPDSVVYTFNKSAGPLPGQGSFREVRLRIDGAIAGLAWPFPVVFTGGIAPPLHRPLVGLEAFDLREDEIDISPWLGVLCDGKKHTFSLEVVGATDSNEVVPNNWVLTGKIFIWSNKKGGQTTGRHPTVSDTRPKHTDDWQSVPESFALYNQVVSRKLDVYSDIKVDGEVFKMAWSQDFSMQNNGYLNDFGNFQAVDATYEAHHNAVSDMYTYFSRRSSYPIQTVYSVKSPNGNFTLTIDANLTQGLNMVVTGETVFPNGLDPFIRKLKERKSGSTVSTSRNSDAFFFQTAEGSGGIGKSDRSYIFGGRDLEDESDSTGFQAQPLLYSRHVTVNNETVLLDDQFVFKSDYVPPPYYDNQKVVAKVQPFAPMTAKGLGGSKPLSRSGSAGGQNPVQSQDTEQGVSTNQKYSAGELDKWTDAELENAIQAHLHQRKMSSGPLGKIE